MNTTAVSVIAGIKSAKQLSAKLNIVIKINKLMAPLCIHCHILKTFKDFIIYIYKNRERPCSDYDSEKYNS